ncbi:hypothetical protein ACS126_03775 [Sphingobacterium lactis]|uniref:hypothetical protein n=1 Tax=Sphingobacterium lactis TaxID=797291 RepID=UPI003EC6D1BD
MENQMKQQVDVIVKMTFEANAKIKKDRLEHQLEYWISETMTLMDDTKERYAYIDSQIIALREEAEIYNLEGSHVAVNRYFAFGNSLTSALKRGDLGRAIGLLNMEIGTLYRFDGTQLIDLIANVHKWDGYHEITEGEYYMLGGKPFPFFLSHASTNIPNCR